MVYEANATVYVPISLSRSLSQKQLYHVCVSAPLLDCTVKVHSKNDDRLLHDPQAAGSDDPWRGGTRHDAEEGSS